MPEKSPVNSKSYWNQRFSDDWKACEGPEQSRFFTQLTLKNLPNWLTDQIKQKSLTVVDWGCAQGDGTNLWLDYTDPNHLFGIDFSEIAINQAQKNYPSVQFSCENWLDTKTEHTRSFDIIFSSNTLEHFDRPYETINILSKKSKKAIVLALPYREHDLIPEHFYTFSADNIPIELDNGYRLVWSKVVDCSQLKNTFWPGEQILLIYTEISWFSSIQPKLKDIEINQTDLTSASNNIEKLVKEQKSLKQELANKENEILNLKIINTNQALAERDGQIASLNQALTERDGQISAMLQSRSWRITVPYRILGHQIKQIRLLETFFLKNNQRSIKHTIASQINYYRNLLPNHYKTIIKKLTDIILNHRKRNNAANSYKTSLQNIKKQPQAHEKPDYFFWGVIDWNFRHQRPQQIAKALAAAGRRVFYISSEIIQSSQNGCHIESLDDSGMLFQIKLFTTDKAPAIYASSPNLSTLKNLKKSLSHVLSWSESQTVISVIHHPFWVDVALSLPNSRQIYDCMDYHDGFGNNHASLIKSEEYLITHADATIVTSTWLKDRIGSHAKHCVIIRNACEYNFFSKKPEKIFHAPRIQSIIGYYGAIAEWFDIDLLEAIAKKFSDAYILLIGNDTCGASNKLKRFPNVHFTGEVSYQELPYYLHSFDVCLLPFKILPLTLATNPVKIYEYMSAGKPIVAVDLPEIQQFNNLVYCAKNTDQFLKMIESALSKQNIQDIDTRKKFASEQTWLHRCQAFIHEAESASRDPLVSIVVVTYNNIDFTKDCLFSIEQHSQYQKLEIIVVDNASSDTTPDFLREWQHKESEFTKKIILNSDNKGFAAANNQGLSIAEGQYLTLLNNDTYVTPGWIRTLLSHLKADKTIGLIGPVTNNIGNQAKINIQYPDIKTMLEISAHHTRNHIGERFQLKTAAFFCVMMPRHVYELIGPLDESFGLGFFEDDDYCRRIEQKGLRIMCAEDVFIHHHLSASFDKIKQTHRQALFEKNKTIYEKKWGTWTPHSYKRDE